MSSGNNPDPRPEAPDAATPPDDTAQPGKPPPITPTEAEEVR